MKQYYKPEITILKFVSMEEISAGLEEWIESQSSVMGDRPEIQSYSVTSLLE
jgi:hypothetical protein